MEIPEQAGEPAPGNPATINAYWFDTLTASDWFSVDAAVDATIRRRFGALIPVAAAGELAHWRSSATGRLAEILLLDQFPRNVHRGTAAAFAYDAIARERARDAITAGADAYLKIRQRMFVYLPLMHSESLADHDEAHRLFQQPGLELQLEHERRHYAVLRRFGRYPQRNAALGRVNTAAEAEFLARPGSGF